MRITARTTMEKHRDQWPNVMLGEGGRIGIREEAKKQKIILPFFSGNWHWGMS